MAKEFESEMVKKLLVLVPYYEAPQESDRSSSALALLNRGATVVNSYGISDIALHRCVLAGMGFDRLVQNLDAYSWVLWLDSDIVVHPAQIFRMMVWANMLGAKKATNLPDCVVVSARYLVQGRRVLAAMSVKDENPIPFQDIGDDGSHSGTMVAKPVYSGMGCMLMHVGTFIHQCTDAPRVTTMGGANSFPAITCSGAIKHDGGVVWASEDAMFCARLWASNHPVYLVPEDVGHWQRDGSGCPVADGSCPTLDEAEELERPESELAECACAMIVASG